jgi:hypothetical protein
MTAAPVLLVLITPRLNAQPKIVLHYLIPADGL